MIQRRFANLTYRLHTARQERMAPSFELRHRFRASAFQAQLRNEKEMIATKIGRLQPGVRRVFMERRLGQLNAQPLIKNQQGCPQTTES